LTAQYHEVILHGGPFQKHRKVLDNFSDPLTIAFLEETGPPPHNPRQYSREMAVDKMFRPVNVIIMLLLVLSCRGQTLSLAHGDKDLE
jgi:hypothetical protein